MDAELMGGAVASDLINKGWSAYLIHLTRGERGNKNKSAEEFGKQLEAELKNSASKLKTKYIWPGYKAGNIPEEECADYINQAINELKIDVIITHWKGSYHPRHVQTNRCVVEAVKRNLSEVKFHHVKCIFFGENMEDMESFVPTCYYDITNTYDTWLQALNSYELFREPNDRFPYKNYYESNSIVRGIEGGVKYAKALMMYPSLMNNLLLPVSLCNPHY